MACSPPRQSRKITTAAPREEPNRAVGALAAVAAEDEDRAVVLDEVGVPSRLEYSHHIAGDDDQPADDERQHLGPSTEPVASVAP